MPSLAQLTDPIALPDVREARLRPDYAGQYPGIEPGVWFNAATLAEHINLRRNRGGENELPVGPRTLVQEHFEFRGGERPVGRRAVLGRRSQD
jgi:hypothetical protein